MCVLIFSIILACNISEFKEVSARYYLKCTYLLKGSTRYICQILIKLEFCLQVFEKYPHTKFCENPPRGNRVVRCGQTDRTKLFKILRPRLKMN